MNHNFKIGDKVKIINNTVRSIHNIGDIGIIDDIKIFYSVTYAQIYNDNHLRMRSWSKIDEIELIEEQTAKFVDETSVITKNGNVFKVGDNVKYSKRSDLKPYIIQNFEQYQNGQIRAVARINNKIKNCNIEDLELIIKPETLLEKAKRLYPIGTKFKNAYRDRLDRDKVFTVTEHNTKWLNSTDDVKGIYSGNEWIVINNTWAEIIKD